MLKEPKDEDRVIKPGEKADPAILYEMAALAQKLGLKSPQISQLLQLCPDRQIALEALFKTTKLDRYRYSDKVLGSIVDRVVDCFDLAILLDGQSPRKVLIIEKRRPVLGVDFRKPELKGKTVLSFSLTNYMPMITKPPKKSLHHS